VVGAIAPKLEQAEIERTRRKPTESLGAYDCHLRAMACFNSGAVDDLKEAQKFCNRALELDDEFAAALALAAFLDAVLVSRGITSQETAEDAYRHARRAVDLEHDDPVVLCMAAWAQAIIVRDLDAASGLVERALALNPNLAMACQFSGWIHLWLGKPDIAIEHFTRAFRLSPLDILMPRMRTGAAHAYFMEGRYDEAMSLACKAIQDWRASPSYRIAAASAALGGHLEEARKFANLLLKLDPNRRMSNLDEVLGPYRRREDIERYKEGLRLAGLPS
jgi:tetratricopeptide (TPR) repeat protein